jgi:hypothetical protein
LASPRLASFEFTEAPATPDSECAIAAFALYVDERGTVVLDRVHLVSLLPPDAAAEQVEHFQRLAVQSAWAPGQDVAGRACGGWAELVLDCNGLVRGLGVRTAGAEPSGAVRVLERLLRDSRAARLEAARTLVDSDPLGLDPRESMWSLDAVRTSFSTFQSHRPFAYDVLQGGDPPAPAGDAHAALWVVRRADTDHTGTFVFLDSRLQVIGTRAYILGE